MSRTKRSIPDRVRASLKPYAYYLKSYSGSRYPNKYALRAYRYDCKMGRDGGYKSPAYLPLKRAPNFIDRWREDGATGPNLKRYYKRALSQLRRREDKKIIARALDSWEHEQ